MSLSDNMTFSLDKSRIPLDKQEEIREHLRAWNREGWLSWSAAPAKKKRGAKKAARNEYPQWFEDLWKDLPVRVGKPQTLQACQEVFKDGYTLEDIRAGIPGYAKEEKRRSLSPDYQKHAPHRWINNHRFLDGQEQNPDKAIKSGADLLVEPLEKALNYRIINHDRVMLLQIVDDMPVEKLLEHTNTRPEYESFQDWLRDTYLKHQ